jgi:hypothetical protein
MREKWNSEDMREEITKMTCDGFNCGRTEEFRKMLTLGAGMTHAVFCGGPEAAGWVQMMEKDLCSECADKINAAVGGLISGQGKFSGEAIKNITDNHGKE